MRWLLGPLLAAIVVPLLGMAPAQKAPIFVMHGIDAGTSGSHYGNNVMMPPGHWQVNAVVNGESASFDLTTPSD
jgi:hypothetical protein